MGLEFRKSPEGQMGARQMHERRGNPLEDSASSYKLQATAMLVGPKKVMVQHETRQHMRGILESVGEARQDLISKFALNLRKLKLLGDIPNDEREGKAFALALVHAYQELPADQKLQ